MLCMRARPFLEVRIIHLRPSFCVVPDQRRISGNQETALGQVSCQDKLDPCCCRCSGGQVAAEADAEQLPRRAGRQGVGAAAPGVGAGGAAHPWARAVLVGVLHRGAGRAAELRRRQRDAEQLGVGLRCTRCPLRSSHCIFCLLIAEDMPRPLQTAHTTCCSCAMQVRQ